MGLEGHRTASGATPPGMQMGFSFHPASRSNIPLHANAALQAATDYLAGSSAAQSSVFSCVRISDFSHKNTMKSVSQNNGPIRVLMVEDNPLDARLVFEYLEDAATGKFQLTHVGRLSEALKTLRTEKPDAILLDLTLPDA